VSAAEAQLAQEESMRSIAEARATRERLEAQLVEDEGRRAEIAELTERITAAADAIEGLFR
jgi:hypothetical protein